MFHIEGKIMRQVWNFWKAKRAERERDQRTLAILMDAAIAIILYKAIKFCFECEFTIVPSSENH